MTYADESAGRSAGAGTATSVRVRLPLTKPVLTYVLLGGIALYFVVETLMGGSSSLPVLVALGAQVNALVASGQPWRLLTAMFLHIGLAHVAFNAWALFVLGRDVEAFYGYWRFAILYFVSGLAGNITYYVLGPNVLSAGASGAVFGLVGAEVAYWLGNRSVFGSLSRQRLVNLAILVVINLFLGFAVRGINNLAHMGGLVSGLALGLALAPHYRVSWDWLPSGLTPRLRDDAPRWVKVLAVSGAVVLLWAGNLVGYLRWAA